MGSSNAAPKVSASVITRPKYPDAVIIGSNDSACHVSRKRSTIGSTKKYASATPATNKATAPTITGITTFFSCR
jgi:hypothetical protein